MPAAGITRDELAVKIKKDRPKAKIYPVEDFRQVVEINLITPIYWTLEMVAQLAEQLNLNNMAKVPWEKNISTRRYYPLPK